MQILKSGHIKYNTAMIDANGKKEDPSTKHSLLFTMVVFNVLHKNDSGRLDKVKNSTGMITMWILFDTKITRFVYRATEKTEDNDKYYKFGFAFHLRAVIFLLPRTLWSNSHFYNNKEHTVPLFPSSSTRFFSKYVRLIHGLLWFS